MAHVKKHSTWMPKAEGLRVQGQLGIHRNLQPAWTVQQAPIGDGERKKKYTDWCAMLYFTKTFFLDFIMPDMHQVFKIKKPSFKVSAKMD